MITNEQKHVTGVELWIKEWIRKGYEGYLYKAGRADKPFHNFLQRQLQNQ